MSLKHYVVLVLLPFLSFPSCEFVNFTGPLLQLGILSPNTNLHIGPLLCGLRVHLVAVMGEFTGIFLLLVLEHKLRVPLG